MLPSTITSPKNQLSLLSSHFQLNLLRQFTRICFCVKLRDNFNSFLFVQVFIPLVNHILSQPSFARLKRSDFFLSPRVQQTLLIILAVPFYISLTVWLHLFCCMGKAFRVLLMMLQQQAVASHGALELILPWLHKLSCILGSNCLFVDGVTSVAQSHPVI